MTAVERTQLRKSLLQLASLLLLTLLSLALMAQFAVWSLQRAHHRSETQSAHVVAALDASRQAQVQFKRQVQEWKNVLLRGADPAMRSHYYDAFSGAELRTARALGEVQTQLQSIGDDDHAAALREILEAHRRLGEQYRQALADASGGRWSPFESDQRVHGLDRPLDALIDRLAGVLREELQTRTAQQEAAMESRYRALRFGLWVAIVVGLVLVGSLLWRALRALGTAA